MRSALLYLVFVGTPLLGLLGILKTGERIVPPPSIGGLWTLEAAVPSLAVLRCPGFVLDEARPQLRVSQSGLRAEVMARDRGRTIFSLSLRGDSIVGISREAAGAECPGGALMFRGRAGGVAGHDRFNGVLSRVSCAECPEIPFVAVRKSESGSP